MDEQCIQWETWRPGRVDGDNVFAFVLEASGEG
jgi:hypothetical protein